MKLSPLMKSCSGIRLHSTRCRVLGREQKSPNRSQLILKKSNKLFKAKLKLANLVRNFQNRKLQKSRKCMTLQTGTMLQMNSSRSFSILLSTVRLLKESQRQSKRRTAILTIRVPLNCLLSRLLL